MNITDQLLDKYFKGQCTPEEQQAINSFLCEVDLLPDHLLTKEEWDAVEDAPLSQEKTDQLFAAIAANTFPKVRRLHWLRYAAAAAVIIVLIAVGTFLFMKTRPIPKIAQNEKNQKEEAHVAQWKSTYNYGNKNVAVVLPDSSEIKVHPGAEISYARDFAKKKREVYLKGSAYFNVSPDKQRPFIVYAGGISTTVLGTSFTITAIEGGGTISVKLHTGKVLVQNISSATAMPSFSKVLTAGEALVLNKATGEVKVVAKQAAIPLMDSLSINFMQTPLPDVFYKLEQHYKVKINCDEAAIKTMFFTGTIDLQIPLDQVLKDVTEVNKLTAIKTDDGFLIKK
ncbi:FecR family protein [Chitinophaga arvensicola]|uniref:Ferric-dicitrate binding protein FerR, regulates iron transport through sigma-19 n=1 Tax=Chitinophaga arvensicola TaxID=29529 RepID=A0A1I0S9W3_9BACT|nr:FecR family protein [Chitinophaga arvensicola]SEW52845.1 ferric-dicitrate binding protein FerR, regulates iron transport through sigma-19 [Chitinophaga arvensicola]